MLVLTRRAGEILRIGDDISVTVLGVKGKQVRLGIDAPTSIPVHRGEVYVLVAEEGPSPIGLPEAPSGKIIQSRRSGRGPTRR